MEETSIDLAMQPHKPAQKEEQADIPHTTSHLKGLLEEMDMEETMKEVEGPPSSSLLQIEASVGVGAQVEAQI